MMTERDARVHLGASQGPLQLDRPSKDGVYIIRICDGLGGRGEVDSGQPGLIQPVRREVNGRDAAADGKRAICIWAKPTEKDVGDDTPT